ncbi:MAG: hypothetical protein V4643_09390, partial [Bacteroidota bacterium]
MKHDKHINIINSLTDIAEIIETPLFGSSQPCKSFGFDKDNITFLGFDKLEKFQNGIEIIFRYNKEISERTEYKILMKKN